MCVHTAVLRTVMHTGSPQERTNSRERFECFLQKKIEGVTQFNVAIQWQCGNARTGRSHTTAELSRMVSQLNLRLGMSHGTVFMTVL